MFNTETIFRVHKNKNYTTMCNLHFDDRRLSLKAVGLHSFILSKPDDWKIIIQNIINSHTDGRESVYSGIRELIELGYWVKYPVRKNGKIHHYQTDIYEEPQPEGRRCVKVEYLLDLCCVTYDSGKTENFNLDGTPAQGISKEEMMQTLFSGNPKAEEKQAENLLPENPYSENHHAEKQQLLNTDIPNTDLLNTEQTVVSDKEKFVDEMKKKIKFDNLLQQGADPSVLKAILEVITETCLSSASTVKLNRNQMISRPWCGIASFPSQTRMLCPFAALFPVTEKLFSICGVTFFPLYIPQNPPCSPNRKFRRPTIWTNLKGIPALPVILNP